MSTLPRRIAAIAVVLLTAAMVAVIAAPTLDLPIGRGPVASPSPVASATPSATPTGEATPSASVDPLEVFAGVEADVQQLRGLPAADIGPPDVISRAELADLLVTELDATWTDEQLAADNLTLRALGLLTAGQDLRALTQQLYEGQVLGFYDFEEKRMVVVSDSGLDAEAKVTYAHEYTHALQDAAFDTGAAHDAVADEDDAALALLALEEGDATWVMFQWAFSHLDAAEMAELGATPLPDMTGIPAWMVSQLEFPYLTGAQWIAQLWSSGGWDAVDAVYDDPPASTEQVLHPEKYAAGEQPNEVTPLDLATALGTGWDEVDPTTVGEAMTSIWLEHLGVGTADATAAAAGWGGDEAAVASGPDDAWALAWTLSWDTAADADEFAETYSGVSADLPFAASLVRISPSETVVLHASSGDVLEALLAVER